MKWEDIKKSYPSKWVIIDVLKAFTQNNKRVIEEVSVVNTFGNDSEKALLSYVELHKRYPEKEFYVVHTSRTELNITEKACVCIKRG